MVIHCPDVCNNKSDYAFETDVWNKHLRKMFNMIQNEFNYIRNKITRIQSDVKFSPIFISFGARLCSMVKLFYIVFVIRYKFLFNFKFTDILE